MQSITRYGTIVVVFHAVIVALHSLAHEKIPVSLSWFQSLFVSSIVVLAPIVATILLWTPFQKAGSWLLLGSMTGALLFGVYYHLIAVSPDQIFQIPLTGWGILFDITAILLVFVEGLGCGVGVWAWKTLQQKEQVL
ncbi:hypothetical protein C7Y66_09435 [Chroococcidiopsis sp. CCALA 051]|uniref:hypothetical protein n=1 Tax=Chroococcidiopsis sp. CCALA 051 TaxID=869949 RepID=UPI000D0D8A5E|nr:hypothetical protein [Chroococcidiopsis sp. CCALA 051]MBE9016564.1 hypothetical protein [Chroococcidiopsidales cyanobacterium LEGE 13417]PSM49392.1 hypothetical protein C7Y66_09435 [Chroococcidiopsis sp. CCALA 051]